MKLLRPKPPAAPAPLPEARAASVSPDEVLRDSMSGRTADELAEAVRPADLDMSGSLVAQIRTLLAAG